MDAHTTPTTAPPRAGAATAHERIDAIEWLLKELVFLLEAAPAFTAEALGRWLQIIRAAERAHGLADARAQVAGGELAERVLGCFANCDTLGSFDVGQMADQVRRLAGRR